MKAKLIGVLVAVAALFIGAVLWRTDSFVYGDRMSWVEAQTRTQLGAMSNSLAGELKSLQRMVATLTPENFQKGKVNWNSLKPYFAAASFTMNGESLEPQVFLGKENSKAASWDKDFVKSVVGTVEGKSSDMRFYVKPFRDAKNGRYVALIFLSGNRAYALFGSGEIFQSLIDAQKGSLSTFSIVTGSGLTVGHPIPEYLGTVMRDDPVFMEAQKSGSSHGSNTFATKAGELFGMYEVVPQSNLVVLSSAALSETMKGRSGLWWQFLLLGCGLILVGIGAVLWVVVPAEKQIETLTEELQAAQSKTAPAAPTAKVIMPDPEIVHKEKVQASMRVASALAHEMRGPLASILGYSQMILAKSPEPEIVKSTDSILREARAARSVLDKLLGYAGEKEQEKNSMKVEGPLAKTLKEMEALFTQKGVKIIKNIQETSNLDLHVDELIRALRNILQNSVEAMERMAKKEIKIDLFEDAEGIHLDIQDSGEGIDPQNMDKIYDPFFTTRSFHNHMGLGLSVAFGILKEHHADLKVESQRAHGTKISILFKKVVAESVMIEKEEPVIIAADLLKPLEKPPQPEVTNSPLDVNIDAMLDFPDEAPVATVDSAATVKVESLLMPQNAFAGEDMKMVENIIDDGATVAIEGPTPAELEMMNDEVIPSNHIAPPTRVAQQKVSKLDAYQVEIRRPGKRI